MNVTNIEEPFITEAPKTNSLKKYAALCGVAVVAAVGAIAIHDYHYGHPQASTS